jgi:hypothetical protein
VSELVLKRALKEDADLQQRMDNLRDRLFTRYAMHQSEMIEMLGQARLNVQEGLNHQDIKVKMDTTWRLIDATVPKQPQQHEIKGEIEAHHEVSGNLAALVGHLDLLKTAGGGADMRDRVKTGADALPGPITLEAAPVEDEQISLED